MSNQELEVGDRVRVVDKTALRCNIGDTAEIISIENRKSTIAFEIDLGDYNQKCSKKQIELISKGEDIMEADSVAVEVDDKSQRLALIDKLNETGFYDEEHEPFIEKGYIFYLYKNTNINPNGRKIGWNQKPHGENYIDEPEKCIKLPEDWGKLKEFLEDNNPEPEIETHHGKVKFKDDGIKIGCKTITNDTIETIYNGLQSLSNQVKEASSNLKIYARDVELTLDEIEEIYEYQLGD